MADETGSGDADAPPDSTADEEATDPPAGEPADAPVDEEPADAPVDEEPTEEASVDSTDGDPASDESPASDEGAPDATADDELAAPWPDDVHLDDGDEAATADGDGDTADGENGPAGPDDPADADIEMREALEAGSPDGEWETVDPGPETSVVPETGADADEQDPEAESDVDDVAEEGSDSPFDVAEEGSDSPFDVAEESAAAETEWDDETAEPDPVENPAAARAAGTGTAPSAPDPSTATAAGTGAGSGVGGGGGMAGGTATAPDDQEMPLTEHIEEMVTRLGVVIVVMALVSGVVFPFADRLINFLWYSFLPGTVEQCPTTSNPDVACPTVYHPLALMFARLKIASLAGFVVALPVMVYESYLFMRPGLYPKERRYYLASVPTSLVLACVGVLFAYFLVLPVLFQYFTGYTSEAARIAFGLSDTFNLIVMMLGFFALVFQIPLLMMLAIMMGVTSRRWLADKRLYFWGGFATIAFIFSPDPTGMAPILVAVTMVVLFEGTLFLLKWTGN